MLFWTTSRMTSPWTILFFALAFLVVAQKLQHHIKFVALDFLESRGDKYTLRVSVCRNLAQNKVSTLCVLVVDHGVLGWEGWKIALSSGEKERTQD